MAEIAPMKLTLVTPEKRLLTDVDVEEVFVPAYRGELNILPGHAPLMTVLETGVLRYRLKGETALHPVVVSWGYCEVTPKGVVVMAETAERPDEVDQERALAAWKLSQEKLGSGELNPELMEKYRRKLQRAEIRRSVGPGGGATTH